MSKFAAIIDAFYAPNRASTVVVSDFLDYRPEQKFDHAVIYGVIEHIPQSLPVGLTRLQTLEMI